MKEARNTKQGIEYAHDSHQQPSASAAKGWKVYGCLTSALGGGSAAVGGCAHLVNFMGTDTVAALVMAREHYGCDIAGFSIPASEHSTMTAYEQHGEVDAFANMIEQYGDNPLYACVSDSYDIYRACRELWGTKLKDKVLRLIMRNKCSRS